MKSSQVALLAGIAVLGYVVVKNQSATAAQGTGAGGSNLMYGGYQGLLSNTNYQPSMTGNGNNYSGLIGAAYNYISGGNSGSGISYQYYAA